ncbi:PP2C family protein-serine/threonine phosphatase [Streptomyces hilarionis]|uniref:PP2C family protein-serine/threonine phosphatase n=1 Tax=Streptomyces hilarionis TaxID=2839954 RepID=UPI00211A17BA|nr:SpoIIE family protein phosphatase [Streptomyces hilarionis]MCQ9130422.1 SpoIIE family protein phosphatase [Streptomyces hilarionis]
MPPHVFADRSAAQPPGRGSVDALISQTRRLKGDMDAARLGAPADRTDPRGRWQRALYELARHQLDDLDAHLAQLRDGPPPTPSDPVAPAAPEAERRASLLSRVGSAEWNLLTDEALWSEELYGILGRDPAAPALTLDELPSLVLEEDRPKLTAMVTDCLVDSRPIDGEFRVVHPDGGPRTVHMMGEPVLDAEGGTASMWAVLRDVSELRRSQREVRESHDSLQRGQHRAQAEHRLTTELREAVLPSWRGPLSLPGRGPGSLDLAARRLPAATASLIGGDWYDALELPDGPTLLGLGDLTGQGPAVTSHIAMMLGALRGMAMAGTGPGQLLTWLNQLLDATVQPALGSALCCRYRPDTRTLTWAQAGHPAPLLFRAGTGRRLHAPQGVLLGASAHAVYGQAEETLEVGDVLVLHTEGPAPGDRLLGLAPRLNEARTAQDCLRTVVEECGGTGRDHDACVLVGRVAR